MYEYKGFFGTLAEVCNQFNLNINDVKAAQAKSDVPSDWFSYAEGFLVKYRGKTINLTTFCSEHGFPREVILAGMKNGKTADSMIDHCINIYASIPESSTVLPAPKVYRYQGETGTLQSLCKKFGYGYTAVSKRILNGMTLEEAFHDIDVKRSHILELDGFKGTPYQILAHFNLSTKGYNTRVKNGMSEIDALSELYNNKILVSSLYTIDGFTGTIKDICKHFGMPFKKVSLILNININELDAEGVTALLYQELDWYRALATPTVILDFSGTLGDILELMELPDYYVVNYKTVFRDCFKDDFDAFVDYIADSYKYYCVLFKDTYNFRGFNGNIQQICERFNMNYVSVRISIRAGKNPLQALAEEYKWQKIINKEYTIGGFTGNVLEIMAHFNLKLPNFKARVIQDKEDPQELLEYYYNKA